jgi:CheY-like chemotaxis protein
LKILIAEESSRIRNIIIEIIGIDGNEFAECSNLFQAHEKHQILKPDITIVDFELLEMNRTTIQNIFPKSKNIIISEYNEEEVLEERLRKSISGFVMKENLMDLKGLIKNQNSELTQ